MNRDSDAPNFHFIHRYSLRTLNFTSYARTLYQVNEESLKKRVATLQTVLEASQAHESDLRQRIDDLMAQRSVLDTTTENLSGKTTQLEEQLLDLRSKHEQLQTNHQIKEISVQEKANRLNESVKYR